MRTLHRSHRVRLAQHGISTRMLEAFLAGMLVCGIVASVVVVVRNTLAKEPCSIAAQISLLAVSRLVGRWWDDAVLGSRLDGFLFGKGWWDGVRRVGIDVDYGDGDDGSEKGLSDREQENFCNGPEGGYVREEFVRMKNGGYIMFIDDQY